MNVYKSVRTVFMKIKLKCNALNVKEIAQIAYHKLYARNAAMDFI